MKISEVIEKVITSRTAHSVKLNSITGGYLDYKVRICSDDDYRTSGFILIDLYSATVMSAVYNTLNDDNKLKWDTIPVDKLHDFSFKHYK